MMLVSVGNCVRSPGFGVAVLLSFEKEHAEEEEELLIPTAP